MKYIALTTSLIEKKPTTKDDIWHPVKSEELSHPSGINPLHSFQRKGPTSDPISQRIWRGPGKERF